jgi:hypothetical protein
MLCRRTPGFLFALTILLGAATATAVHADRLHTFHYGLGPSLLFVNSGYGAIGSQGVVGVTLESSARVGDDLYVDSGTVLSHIHTGPTSGVSYPAGSASYLVLWGTVRKNLWPIARRNWAPWLALGINYSDIDWEGADYEISGFGYSVQFGADWKLDRSWRLRAQFGQHGFSASDNYNNGPWLTDLREVSAALMYRLPVN